MSAAAGRQPGGGPTPTPPGLRVALVHDWLTGMRGGEKVLEVLCELYPDATLLTLLHNRGSVSATIEGMSIHTSFIQRLPFRAQHYRRYLPFFPAAIERFDLSEYDLVLSSSHCVAKGVRPGRSALHVCYCHTPMRYVWDRYEDYFGRAHAGLATRLAMKGLAPYLRRWDRVSQDRVHRFIANSRYVAQRIRQYYGRHADVIHPPVDTDLFELSGREEGYYLMVTALVPYKRVHLAIEAFRGLKARLVIAGTGPQERQLRAIAPPNVEFLGWQAPSSLVDLYGRCRAVVFPGVEDFGIVPVEAMATGKPVVAFAGGGALETVIDGVTGVLFQDPTPDALADAVARVTRTAFDPLALRRHAERFSRVRFSRELREYIAAAWPAHLAGGAEPITPGGRGTPGPPGPETPPAGARRLLRVGSADTIITGISS